MCYGFEQSRWETARAQRPLLELKNAFELWAALQLAGFVALVMLAVRIITLNLGDQGLRFLAALSGLVDVDAITLPFAHKSNADLSLRIAEIGIATAAGHEHIHQDRSRFPVRRSETWPVRIRRKLLGHHRGSVGMWLEFNRG